MGLNPAALQLELTESVLMEGTQKHSDTLENLACFGTTISAGHSSLKYLTYPVNRLKLAQEFVFRVTVDYRNVAMVRATIRLAHELGVEVIAEGAGCEHGQGYYFSRPVNRSARASCCARGGSSLAPSL